MYEQEEEFLEFQKAYSRIIDKTNGSLEKIRLNFLKEYKIWSSVYLIAFFIAFFVILIILIWVKYFEYYTPSVTVSGVFLITFAIFLKAFFIGSSLGIFTKRAESKNKFKNIFKEKFKEKASGRLLSKLNIATWNINFSANDYRWDENISKYIKNIEYWRNLPKEYVRKAYIDDEFCGKYKDVDYKALEISLSYDMPNIPHYVIFELNISNDVCFDINFSTKNFITKVFNMRNLPKIIITLFLYISFLLIIIPAGYDNTWTLSSIFTVFCFLAVSIFYIFYIIKKLSYYAKNKRVVPHFSEFRKLFKIYSNNPIAAESILYPAFLQSLNELKFVFKTKNIECKFCEDKIVIAIETNKADLFEFGDLHKSVEDSSVIYQFYREIHSIFNIIDALKSN